MSNTWFQFKQFTINQANSAMKVSTDGVLLGAWVNISEFEETSGVSLLDVGTGTGLIALMLAQKSEKSQIKAIELDAEACKDAVNNFEKSPWSNRLSLIKGNFIRMNLGTEKFDHIVCNPPYFTNSLKAKNGLRNLARHDDDLPVSDFLYTAEKILKQAGTLNLILPYARFEEVTAMSAKIGFSLNRKTTVATRVGEAPKRVLAEWARLKKPLELSEISIYLKDRNQYTEEFINLTKNYYLSL